MAFSRIQATGKITASGVSSFTITFGSLPAVGSGIVVGVLASTTSAFPAGSCTDNQGNSYSIAYQQDYPFGGRKSVIFYCPKISTSSGTFIITVNPALGSLTFYGVAVEVGGVGGGLTIDVLTAGAQGISSAPNAGASTARTVNDVFSVGSFVTGVAQTTIAVNTGWTQELEELTTTPIGEIDSQVETAASGTAINISWTMTTSDWWGGRVTSFKALPAPVSSEKSYAYIDETVAR